MSARSTLVASLALLLAGLASAQEEHAPGQAPVSTGFVQVQTPGTGEVRGLTYGVYGGMAVHEGDILLGPAAEVEGPGTPQGTQASVAIKDNLLGSFWPDGIIPYVVDPSYTPGTHGATELVDAIAAIEAATSIRIVPRTTESDYVVVQDSGGCSSYIGLASSQQPGQGLFLAPGCSTGNTIHEFIHAIGTWHEHTRLDRDSYVVINTGNIQAGKEGNFTANSSTFAQDIGTYDYAWIMHYGSHFFSSNGQPTIEAVNPVPGDALGTPGDMGQRSGMTAEDAYSINFLYHVDLAVGASGPAEAPAGSDFDLTVTVQNESTSIGNVLPKGGIITLDLPGDAAYRGFSSPDGWSCSETGGVVTCTQAWVDRTAQESITLQLTAPTSPGGADFVVGVACENRDLDASDDSATAAVTVTPPPLRPRWLRRGVVMDLGGDGRDDLHIRDTTGSGVAINGQAGPALGNYQSADLGSDQYDLVLAGDFDGDGNSDLYLRDTDATTNRILPGDGQGGLGAQVAIPGFSPAFDVVRVGDFDGDGRSDIYVHSTSTGASGVFPGTPNFPSQYLPKQSYGSTFTVVEVGDFNGDGKDDLFVHAPSTGASGIFPGDVNYFGGFQATPGFSSNFDTYRVADFDGDGKEDLFIRVSANGFNGVFPGASSGFGAFGGAPFAATHFDGFFPGDFDGDGDVDMFLRSPSTGINGVLAGGPGGLDAYTPTAANGAAWSIQRAADFDGDGRTDMFFRNTSTNFTGIFPGVTGGGFLGAFQATGFQTSTRDLVSPPQLQSP